MARVTPYPQLLTVSMQSLKAPIEIARKENYESTKIGLKQQNAGRVAKTFEHSLNSLRYKESLPEVPLYETLHRQPDRLGPAPASQMSPWEVLEAH